MTQTQEIPARTIPPDGRSLARSPQRQSALAEMAARFAIQPDRLMEVLKATVIKPTDKHVPTNEEVAAFIVVANQYGLNPFTREIHAFADSTRGVVPIVGVDGWAHIVNAHEQFDGCEFGEVEDENGDPLSITCIMFVKNRAHPIKITERFKECRRNTAPWNQYKWRMLRHKAFMQAARIAFSISGIYDEDEAKDIIANVEPEPTSEQTQRGVAGIKSKLAAKSGEPTKLVNIVTEDDLRRLQEEKTRAAAATNESQPAAGSPDSAASARQSSSDDPPLSADVAGSLLEDDQTATAATQSDDSQEQQSSSADAQATPDISTYANLYERIAELGMARGVPSEKITGAMTTWLVGLKKKGRANDTTQAERDAAWQKVLDGVRPFEAFAGSKGK